MHFLLKLIFFCLLNLSLFANSSENNDLEDLLDNIKNKTDLSSKTKLENGGISFIYTRNDLERMQVKYLKDILKATYPFGYNENKSGRPDPLTFGTNAPYVSSMMRVFIDNQEIISGIFGSGIFVLGDIDIGFVDHVEVYTQNPSYEFSTESTFVLVKLYTKVAQKDEGGKIELSSSSYGGKKLSTYYTKELDKWSYFNYITSDDLQREDYKSKDTTLSRDKKRTHILSSIYTKDQRILLQAIKSKEDSFIGKSVDATPKTNTLDMDFIHIGYDANINNFSYLFSYEYMNTQYLFEDDIGALQSLDTEVKSNVYTSELKYNYTTTSNKLVLGTKYRIKKYDYSKRMINGVEKPKPVNDTQTIASVFLENQYSIENNSIITTGLSYSSIKNNNTEQNDNLFMYRFGHTFTTSNFIIKTIASHVEMTISPYLVNGDNSYIVAKDIDIQSLDSIISNIIYEKENNKYEIILQNLKSKKYLVPNSQGLLDNHDKTVVTNGILTRWTYEYNKYDKLFLTLSYMKKNNLPFIDEQKIYRSIVRNINTYKDFDIFNEIIFYKNDTYDKDFYDYSAGIIYHKTQDLSISLKGENLLNKAKTTKYARIDPSTLSSGTPQLEEPLYISPIDRRVTISLEYLF